MRPARLVRPLLYALLAANTVWYLATEPSSKGLDSLAWYALLVLFALEAAAPAWLARPHARRIVHALRAAAATAIVAATAAYLARRDWLDALNSVLWILVVLMLEWELRRPGCAARHRRRFAAAAAVLYTAIAALIPLWASDGAWLDAWDAALWLAAFALIELDLLRAPAQG